MKRTRLRWGVNFAYAVGLITTDGCLYNHGRHIALVSKDIDQLQNFAKCLSLKNNIGVHASGYTSNRKYYHIQFGDVRLYRFLLKIGLTAHTSHTLGNLVIPDTYFRDFLRGHLDGDGCIYTYWDSRWKRSFMLYTRFYSASQTHLVWLRGRIKDLYNIDCVLKKGSRVFLLEFAKKSSVSLLHEIYYKEGLICLERKHSKKVKAFAIIDRQAGVAK